MVPVSYTHLDVYKRQMDERHGATTANAKRYIDFAAANNIEAVMFEGGNEGWESWGGMQTFDYTKPYADFDMAEVARLSLIHICIRASLREDPETGYARLPAYRQYPVY